MAPNQSFMRLGLFREGRKFGRNNFRQVSECTAVKRTTYRLVNPDPQPPLYPLPYIL